MLLFTSGLGRSEGLLWRTHRRFMLRTFHDMGVSREVIERRLLCGVADRLVNQLSGASAAAGGEAIDPEHFLTRALGLVMLRLLWGFDSEYDTGYEQMLDRLQDSLKMVGKTSSIFALIAYKCALCFPLYSIAHHKLYEYKSTNHQTVLICHFSRVYFLYSYACKSASSLSSLPNFLCSIV